MIEVDTVRKERIYQGDIFKDIEYIEQTIEKEGIIEISKIIFPLVIVLTQDCDLEQDFFNRRDTESKNQDKHLFSAIVAPLYNAEDFLNGNHLSELNLKMQLIKKKKQGKDTTHYRFLKINEIPRYHYLEFKPDIPIVNSVIDFKHYFTIHIETLMKIKNEKFVCKVCELYREDISHRFANFLSRIGLPK